MMRLVPLLIALAALAPQPRADSPSTLPRFLAPGAKVQVVADGFQWAEGPLWVSNGAYLLFSDVPRNRIYRWSPGRPAALFLEPSGGTDTIGFREPGSNGLKPGIAGSILVADQGNRALAVLDLRTKAKALLTTRYQGKRFNSPNDLAVAPDGAIWFTDPPYGLEGIDASPLKEQPANGVYRLAPDGRVELAVADLAFPNGIAFSRDGKTLYVSNSDPQGAQIIAWDAEAGGRLSRRRILADMTELARQGQPGLPDGMTVDDRGNLWATGPGGVHVFAPGGRELGVLSTGGVVSNVAFGGSDGHTLFMTSAHKLLSVLTTVRGATPRTPLLRENTR